jgi:hypothetical protein
LNLFVLQAYAQSSCIAFCAEKADMPTYCVNWASVLLGNVSNLALIFPCFPQVACLGCSLCGQNGTTSSKLCHLIVNCCPISNSCIRKLLSKFTKHFWSHLYLAYVSYDTIWQSNKIHT